VPDASTYYPAPGIVFSSGNGHTQVAVGAEGGAVPLDALSANVLAACRGARTLAEHAAVVRSTGVHADADRIAGTLERLASSGLLQRFIATATTERPSTRAVDVIGVITADRPQSLRRCLGAVASSARGRGHEGRLIVVDGSSDDVSRADNRAAAAECGQHTSARVQYFGVHEAAALRHTLVSQGIGRPSLDFGLSAGATGASRNLLTLLGAGRDLITCDDDIVCEPWALVERQDGLVLAGHDDLRRTEFFSTRREALARTQMQDIDMLLAHGALLDRPLASILSGGDELDLSDACGHMVAMAASAGGARVRVTFAGLAGDSGRYCPTNLLFSSSATRRRVMTDRAPFETALSSREIVCVAERTIVTHDAWCMAYYMGLANRQLLPPFMPLGHNEDGVFGEMLAFIDATALFAHLPHGVVHDADRPSDSDNERIPSATETRLSALVLLTMQRASSSIVGGSPSNRLRRLGQWFLSFGSLEPEEFATVMSRFVLEKRCRELAYCETAQSEEPGCHAHWRDQFSSYRDTFLSSVKRPDFFVPVEFKHGRSPDEGFLETQRFFRDYGSLMMEWPDIWATAKALRLLDD
jgi:hypothetical protein